MVMGHSRDTHGTLIIDMGKHRRGGGELCPTFSVFNFLIRLWLSSSSSSFFTKIEFPINPESGVLLLTSPTAEEVQWKGLLLPPLPPLAPKP